MSKLQAIIAIVMISVGIVAGAWFGFVMAGWIGAMLFFPFGGGLGYFIGARPSIIWDILGAALS
jgi:hypothetical protein